MQKKRVGITALILLKASFAKKLQIFLKYFLLLNLIFVLILICVNVYIDNEISLAVSTSSFAILLSIGSLCFSWVRAISDNEQKLKESLRMTGQVSVGGALLVLMAALLNYLISYAIEKKEFSFLKSESMQFISFMISFFIFAGGVAMFCIVIFRIIRVLAIIAQPHLFTITPKKNENTTTDEHIELKKETPLVDTSSEDLKEKDQTSSQSEGSL